MNLLYPIGLLALAGLIIPVLLHLWNVKQGKTLKIGSIALLGEEASSSARSFKITDWLLFILRCLIIILIAFLLAQPFLKKTINTSKNSGWILVDRNQFSNIYSDNQKTIDSLINLGFELRDFNLGFNQFFLKDSLDKINPKRNLSYTTLLKQLNQQIPAGYSAYLFADHKLVNFDADLPKLSFNLIWRPFKQSDTIKTWPAKFLNKAFEAKSTSSVTNYTVNNIQHLPTIKVLIYDPTGNDGTYIKAGLNAISDFTKRKFEVKKWSLTANAADFVFWLSDESFNDNLQPNANLFAYQKGKISKLNTSINLGETANQKIELKQRIAFDQLNGKEIWTDGFGTPLLIKKRVGKVNHFFFYSRFNPNWGDLVWSAQFTRVLLPIVLDDNNLNGFGYENHPADQRIIDKAQLPGGLINKTGTFTVTKNQDLSLLVWFLAFVLLFIERVLSFRKKTENVKN